MTSLAGSQRVTYFDVLQVLAFVLVLHVAWGDVETVIRTIVLEEVIEWQLVLPWEAAA